MLGVLLLLLIKDSNTTGGGRKRHCSGTFSSTFIIPQLARKLEVDITKRYYVIEASVQPSAQEASRRRQTGTRIAGLSQLQPNGDREYFVR